MSFSRNMGYKIRFKYEALAQLDSLYAYIRGRDRHSADLVISRLHVFFIHLGTFPDLGRVTDKAQVRRFPVGKTGMVVFYTFNDRDVTILRILHAHQLKK